MYRPAEVFAGVFELPRLKTLGGKLYEATRYHILLPPPDILQRSDRCLLLLLDRYFEVCYYHVRHNFVYSCLLVCARLRHL